MNREEKCAHCLAYHEQLEGGQCRAHSPVPQLIMAQTLGGAQPQVIGIWPAVSQSDWCLEYQARALQTH